MKIKDFDLMVKVIGIDLINETIDAVIKSHADKKPKKKKKK